MFLSSLIPGTSSFATGFRRKPGQPAPSQRTPKAWALILGVLMCHGIDTHLVCAAEIPSDHPQRLARGTELFTNEIRGLLTSQCLPCHGGEKTKGGFDLATREGLLLGGAEGVVVQPFQPTQSKLLRLLRHEEEPHMPEKKPALSRTEIERIEQWIHLGAPYDRPLVEGKSKPRDGSTVSEADKSWWAFQPLKRSEPPPAKSKGNRHPIDRFIEHAAREKQLSLAPAADPRSLVRRAHFELTGLPPDEVEIRAFARAPSARAWESLLDRLLDSPHYGERWARHWLDIARFAESSGFEHDYDRKGAYHYRDFVIKALNQGMPFNRFLEWQLAGDELAPGDPLAMTATGFLGAGVFPTQITANEVERTRYDAMDDMLSTSSLAFLGLSVGCARCHDHKFDPIPARDYYRMLSTFTTTVRSVIDLDLDPENTRRRTLQWERELKPIEQEMARHEKRLQPRFTEWLQHQNGRTRPLDWRLLDWTNAVSKGGATLRRMEDGSFFADGKNADQEEYTFTAALPDEKFTALRLDALSDARLKAGGPGRADNGNFGLSKIRILAQAPGEKNSREFKITRAEATFQQNDSNLGIRGSLDDNDQTGWAVDPKFGHDHSALFVLENPAKLPAGTAITVKLIFRVNTRHHLGRPRISVTGSESPRLEGEVVTARVVELLAQAGYEDFLPSLSASQRLTLFDWWKTRDSTWLEHSRKREAHLKKKPDGRVEVLVCGEGYPPLRMHSQGADFFNETHFLKRGNTDLKDGVAELGFLQVLAPAPTNIWFSPSPPGAKYSSRRSAMARWMSDVERGAGALSARVIVNRMWQHHFGEGLVRTPNDFGKTGELPTHPELLDWLAGQLVASGWRLKPIHKLIMTSATYRQSSAPDRLKEAADPENRSWTRRIPRRLEGEAIRDSILAVSGSLDRTMFGPGTFDESSRRRSVYFTIKRSRLVGSMVAFDLPEPLVSQSARPTTTVAPQALFLMNGPQVRDWARAFAQSIDSPGAAPDNADAAVRAAYARALGRPPGPDELREAVAFVSSQIRSYESAGKPAARSLALTDFCQVLFGLNEFAYVP